MKGLIVSCQQLYYAITLTLWSYAIIMAHTYLQNRSQSLTNQISAATEIVNIYIVLVKVHCFTIVGRQWRSSGLSDER